MAEQGFLESENVTSCMLNLAQIASWQNVNLTQTPIIARVPSLQRGAVWKPAQVELLWDSILRGFPIGAFVVCQKLKSQTSRKGKHDRHLTDEDDRVTHHLLDGQQRANAIALGFDDPFSGNESPIDALWLDLEPEIAKNSTRSFLFRVTTLAHPWGYTRNDTTTPLSASSVREALEEYGWRRRGEKEKPDEIDKEGRPPPDKILKEGRPQPNQSWPNDCTAPIPVAWLIKCINKTCITEYSEFWMAVHDLCVEKNNTNEVKPLWLSKAIKSLDSIKIRSKEHRKAIFIGLRRALNMRVVILNVPQAIITTAAYQEDVEQGRSASGYSEDEGISNVEHLFARLNSGGTTLLPEELAYSMIKAYWPGIEKPIESLVEKRMPAARLLMLGARVAVADIKTPPKILPEPFSVARLRRIALSIGEKDQELREHIHGFFLSEPAELKSVLDLVNAWLGDDKPPVGIYGIGLPPVLRTAISMNSPDVFLLLMWLARRALYEAGGDYVLALKNTESVRVQIIGLSTSLHWFSHDKKAAVIALYQQLKDILDRNIAKKLFCSLSFEGLLKKIHTLEGGKLGIMRIPTPESLKALIVLPSDEPTLIGWRWWKQARDNDNQELPEYAALQKITKEEELLIYAQRAFVQSRFGSYDPARKDLWEQHNRPWDFDHIIPSSKVYYQHGIPEGVRQWVYCIANLRVWPMEDNRSDQDVSPYFKLGMCKVICDSFINSSEYYGFQDGFINIRRLDAHPKFLSAAKARLIRIYGEWYHSLEISRLIGE